MKFKNLCESRYSVRAYLPKAVEHEKIEYIIECARLSPSACNFQPWVFYVIMDEMLKSEIYKAYDREWFKAAPVHIVVCKDSSLSWKRSANDGKDFGDVDAAIAAEHICLAADEIGLGTCWICNFNPSVLVAALELPDNLEAIAIFPIGYIDTEKSEAPVKKRKPASDITRWI